ncbi:MAG: type IV pilin protein [Planctomycetota bacterium]
MAALRPPRRQAGFTLIELMIVLLIIALVAALAVPQLTQSRKSGHEVSAIGSLRSIKTSQERYRQLRGRFGTVADLVAMGLLDESFSGPRSGYVFASPSAPTTTGFEVTAEPMNAQAGDRYFYLNASGVVRFSTAGTADATSAPIR